MKTGHFWEEIFYSVIEDIYVGKIYQYEEIWCHQLSKLPHSYLTGLLNIITHVKSLDDSSNLITDSECLERFKPFSIIQKGNLNRIFQFHDLNSCFSLLFTIFHA